MISYDVVEWGRPLVKSERETPRPQGAEVLVRVKYCGVCHSDAHMREGYFDLGGGKRLHMTERGMGLPATFGHEPYGTVIATGPDSGDTPLGVDCVVYPWTGCGACVSCEQGLDNYCASARCIGLQRAGGYADHLLVPHPRYLIEANGIDPAWAATLSCSGLSSYSAISKLMPIAPEQWIAVIGAGGLGLSAVGILRALEHERIIAVDIDDVKLQVAEKAGAAVLVNSRSIDAAEKILQRAGGSIYGAVDMVGSADTARLGLSLLRKGGKLIVVGLYGGEIPLSLVSTVQRALIIQGSHLGSVAELRAVIKLARAGKLRPLPIEKRPLSEVSRTLDELKAGAIVGRVVVEIPRERAA